ncbi:EF-hand domain-containing protein [Streptomyces sp. NPDC000594]|uniref:EF-hand domain-containing protein n=1 Tax=Streptomyces sp. NPDC000594 TaxID=3154261 RepID=UPI003334508E
MATADVVGAKHERAFRTLDANGDDHVEWADYQALVDRFTQAYGLDTDDRRVRALRAFFQIFWLELLRHADVAGDRLTSEQFIQANRLAAIDTSRVNIVEGSSHAIFDCIDADGDHEITQDEFARYLRDVCRVDAPDALDSFAQLDTDGNGVISRHEFIRASREYFHSADAGAAGSLFFGRI